MDDHNEYLKFLLSESRTDEAGAISAMAKRAGSRLKSAALATVGGEWSSVGQHAHGELDVQNLTKMLSDEWFRYAGQQKGQAYATPTLKNIKAWFQKHFDVALDLGSSSEASAELVSAETVDSEDFPAQYLPAPEPKADPIPTAEPKADPIPTAEPKADPVPAAAPVVAPTTAAPAKKRAPAKRSAAKRAPAKKPKPDTAPRNESYLGIVFEAAGLVMVEDKLNRSEFDRVMKLAAQELMDKNLISSDGSIRQDSGNGGGKVDTAYDTAADKEEANSTEEPKSPADQQPQKKGVKGPEPLSLIGGPSSVDVALITKVIIDLGSESGVKIRPTDLDRLITGMKKKDHYKVESAVKAMSGQLAAITPMALACIYADDTNFDREEFRDIVLDFCRNGHYTIDGNSVTQLANAIASQNVTNIEHVFDTRMSDDATLALTIAMAMGLS